MPGEGIGGKEVLSCNTAFDGLLISRYEPKAPWEALLRIGVTRDVTHREGGWVGKRLSNSMMVASGSQWAINPEQSCREIVGMYVKKLG